MHLYHKSTILHPVTHFFSETTEPILMKLGKLNVLIVNEVLKHFGVGWVTLPPCRAKF